MGFFERLFRLFRPARPVGIKNAHLLGLGMARTMHGSALK